MGLFLYVVLHIETDSKERLVKGTKRCDKRYDFNFVNFPFICSNISVAHESWVFSGYDEVNT